MEILYMVALLGTVIFGFFVLRDMRKGQKNKIDVFNATSINRNKAINKNEQANLSQTI